MTESYSGVRIHPHAGIVGPPVRDRLRHARGNARGVLIKRARLEITGKTTHDDSFPARQLKSGLVRYPTGEANEH